MKKGKVLTGGQLALVAMVLVLGGAVWLNAAYSDRLSQKTKYLGEAVMVDSEPDGEAVATAAGAATDYFTTAAAERTAAYAEAAAAAEELLGRADVSDEQKKSAADTFAALSKRQVDEAAAEELLRAKGFKENLVILSENSATVVVQSGELSAAESLQIKDAVTSLCGVSPGNLKIVTVDG